MTTSIVTATPERRVLVTGAAGFIGSHTIEALLKRGCRVLGLDNLRTGRLENLASVETDSRFSFERVDVANESAVAPVIRAFKPHAVIHLAALVSVQQSLAEPTENFRLNVLTTHTIAEACRNGGVNRLVFASSAAVYGNIEELPITERAILQPISPYGAAKLASENLLLGYARAYGLIVRCHRYFNVYGPRQDPSSPYSGVVSIFLQRYMAGQRIKVFGDGLQTRDFVFVQDVAAANVIATLRENLSSGVANICTGRSVSLNELIASFTTQFPKAFPPEYLRGRPGDIRDSLGSPDLARDELGFVAEVPLAAGLRELIEHEAIRLHN